MTIKARLHTIGIRLSDKEYSDLKHQCVLTDARSISDFVRDSLRVVLNNTNGRGTFATSFEDIHVEIKDIKKKLEIIEAEIKKDLSEHPRSKR